jgi:hypothetical protein
MLRLLGDENFNYDIVRGLLRRRPSIDIVSVHDVGLRRHSDREVLLWAASNNRIVVTHDRATMPSHAYEQVAAGLAVRLCYQQSPADWTSNRRTLATR